MKQRCVQSICMTIISAVCISVIPTVSAIAQAPTWDWVADGKLTGTPIFGGITTYGIGVDKSGNVFFGGAIADPCTVGGTPLTSAGGNDIFLAKTNSSGVIQWAKRYGTANADQIIDMITDTAGNLYAQIYFGSPSFNLDSQTVTSLIFGVCIAKFDANGKCTRAKTTQPIAISTGGLDYSPLGFMAAVNQNVISKINMNCDTLWTRTIPGSTTVSVVYYDVTIDKDGNIYACGTFGGNPSFGGIVLTTPSIADLDCFIVKYNSSGVVQWAKQFGTRGILSEYATAIAVDQGGHAYVAGTYMSKLGVGTDTLTNSVALTASYVIKYSPAGVYEKALNCTSTNQNFARGAVCDKNNNLWFSFNPSGTFNFAGADHIPSTTSGTMIVSIDTSGAFRKRLKTDGQGLSDPKRLVFNHTGDAFYVGGYHLSYNPPVVTFGATTLTTSGCYVAKADPHESIASCCIGTTGNVDCDPGQGIDISDLARLIDNLFISFDPLCCVEEANIDGAGSIDISDLSRLIDFLFINFTPPAACP